MPDPSLGNWLRTERERRGITIKAISDQTKIAAPLLAGLENDDLAHWPDGIYRRGFVRAYASAVGLDPDEVARRFELEHGAATAAPPIAPAPIVAPAPVGAPATAEVPASRDSERRLSRRARVLGTLADLTVVVVLAMGSAAAGSRLLWPVLLIAAYYALGILLTGTSPMVALLRDESAGLAPELEDASDTAGPRLLVERRHQRRNTPRAVRPTRTTRPRVQ